MKSISFVSERDNIFLSCVISITAFCLQSFECPRQAHRFPERISAPQNLRLPSNAQATSEIVDSRIVLSTFHKLRSMQVWIIVSTIDSQHPHKYSIYLQISLYQTAHKTCSRLKQGLPFQNCSRDSRFFFSFFLIEETIFIDHLLEKRSIWSLSGGIADSLMHGKIPCEPSKIDEILNCDPYKWQTSRM